MTSTVFAWYDSGAWTTQPRRMDLGISQNFMDLGWIFMDLGWILELHMNFIRISWILGGAP